MGLGHKGPTEVQAQGQKYKNVHLGGGPKMKRSLANCKITNKKLPEWLYTKQVSHGPLLCIGQTGLSVFGFLFTRFTPPPLQQEMRSEPQVGNMRCCQSTGSPGLGHMCPSGPGPKGKIQKIHLGGGIPRNERRRQLPVYKIRTQGAPTKKCRSFPFTGGHFLGVTWTSAVQRPSGPAPEVNF